MTFNEATKQKLRISPGHLFMPVCYIPILPTDTGGNLHTDRAHDDAVSCAHPCTSPVSCRVGSLEAGRQHIDRLVRVAACSSRSSCPLGVKDTDVTALITEAGSHSYKRSQQQAKQALLG